jgi:hypothetical protein
LNKYSIITNRDKTILELIEELRLVDLYVVDNMLFSNTKGTRVAQRRLTTLCEARKLKRYRENQISSYVYYKGSKPKNIKHSLLVSHFVAELKLLGAEIIKIKREWLISKGIKIDLFIAYKINGKNYIAIVEVENTKSFQEKYNKLENYYLTQGYRELFPIMPKVICISDKSFNKNILEAIQVDTEFSNIKLIV